MNNYCRHCGYKFEEKIRKCPNCNTSIIGKRYDIDRHFITRRNELMCFIIICSLSFIRVILYFFESNGDVIGNTGMFVTIGLLLTTSVAKVQYNNSKLINFAFYGIFLLISLFIIIGFLLKDSYGF